MKKIIYAIINFFKLLLLTILSPFLKNKKEEEPKKDNIIKSDKLEQLKKQQLNATGAVTGTPPDDNTILANYHDDVEEDGDIESTRIYSLPHQLGRILDPNEKYSYLAFSDEEIDDLINKELEDKYKEQNFKIYKANNILKKKIDKFKKEIIPKIKDKIYYNNITNEKLLKREIKEIIEEQLLLTPLIEVIVEEKKEEKKPLEVKKEEDPYFIAIPRKKGLELPEIAPKVDKDDVIVNLDNKDILEEKLELPSLRMVKNTDEIKEPTVLSELPKLAAATAITVAKEAVEIVTAKPDLPKLKEDKKEEPKLGKKEDIVTEVEIKEEEKEVQELPTPEEEKTIEEEIKEIIVESDTIVEEVDTIEQEVEETIKKQEEIDEEITSIGIEEQHKEEEKKEDIKKDIVLDMQIDSLDNKVFDVVDDAKEESAKFDFFEKDYDNQEEKIDKMLDKISDTRIKYGDKLTKKQKERLKEQEDKLRSAKEKLEVSKEKDIAYEKKELDDTIKEVEIEGLKKEVESMHLQYKMETNNNLLKKMDKLEGMTKEQVASTDRKIMMSRFNKASFLLEMTSLLAFPFVRNKYFRLFTIGLVVDNHLGFAHAFLNRKANRYQPVDLESIKKGQDALDGAIDLAYKDLVQLDYIEEQALSKYPELANDPAYQASVARIRNNLNNQFNKLQHKQQTMDKYLNKGKRQKKVLKKIEGTA